MGLVVRVRAVGHLPFRAGQRSVSPGPQVDIDIIGPAGRELESAVSSRSPASVGGPQIPVQSLRSERVVDGSSGRVRATHHGLLRCDPRDRRPGWGGGLTSRADAGADRRYRPPLDERHPTTPRTRRRPWPSASTGTTTARAERAARDRRGSLRTTASRSRKRSTPTRSWAPNAPASWRPGPPRSSS